MRAPKSVNDTDSENAYSIFAYNEFEVCHLSQINTHTHNENELMSQSQDKR